MDYKTNWDAVKNAINEFAKEVEQQDDSAFAGVSAKTATLAAFDSVVKTMENMEAFDAMFKAFAAMAGDKR